LCLVMPSRCTGQNNQRGAPYTLWLPSPLFVVSGHALPLYRSKPSARSSLHFMATKPTFCCVWSYPPAVQVKTISEELPTLYGYLAHFLLCLVMPSRCTGQNNQRGAPYTLWLPSPLFVVSGHALPLYRSKQSSRSSLHFMATKPTLCCVWSYPPAVQVKTISEELGVGFMGSGFDPKWQIKDIPLMPKDR